MSWLADRIRSSSSVQRIWRVLQGRLLLGTGYGLAVALTALSIILAASPPASGPIGPASRLILTVLSFNLVLILALAAVATLQLAGLVHARGSDAGARLHLRFVTLFAMAAVVPAVVVALFMGVLVNQGVDRWLGGRVQTVVENSATVFRSYVDDQKRYIGDHVTVMGADLNREASLLRTSPITFSRYLEVLASYHAFPAAYLVDVGHYVSDSGHHKHSYYVISNSDIAAFTQRERLLVACLCRYHRKSLPSPVHSPYQALSADDRRTLLYLIPLLRLADNLNRSRQQRIRGIDCRLRDGAVQLRVRSNQDIDLEQWGAERAGEAFQQIYSRRIEVQKERD